MNFGVPGVGVFTRVVEPTHAGLLGSSYSSATQGSVQYEFLRRMSGVT